MVPEGLDMARQDVVVPDKPRMLGTMFAIILLGVLVVGGTGFFFIRPLFASEVQIKLVGSHDVFTYDGTRHMASPLEGTLSDGRVEVTGSDGHTYYVSGVDVSASAEKPSESVMLVRMNGEPQITDENGNDVTERVNVSFDPGSLTIEPRPLYLESADASKEFDGKPLSDSGKGLVTEEGFVSGDGASYKFTSEQVVPGETSNNFAVTWDKGTDPDCYDVHQEFGELEVTPREKKLLTIKVEGKSDSVPFDGKEHTFSAIEDGEEREVTVDGVDYVVCGLSSTVAKGTKSGKYSSEVKKGANFAVYLADDEKREHDLSSQFDVKGEAGTLEILPSDVYVATFFGSDYDWTDTVYASVDGKSFYAMSVVPNEMRDPCIMFKDGWYWVITCRNDEDGHLWLDVSRSSDLVHWTEPSLTGPFSLDRLPDRGGNEYDVVAPEWFLDTDGSVHVIVSCGWWGGCHGAPTDDYMDVYMLDVSSLAAAGDGCAMTAKGPARWLSINSDGADRIDGTIDHVGDWYYLTVKRNGLTMELWRSKTLDSVGWERVRDKSLYGFEAPCVIQVADGWRMFADGVPDVEPYGTRMWESDKIDGQWVEKDISFFDFDGHEVGVVRHGTVLPVDYVNQKAAHDAITAYVKQVSH